MVSIDTYAQEFEYNFVVDEFNKEFVFEKNEYAYFFNPNPNNLIIEETVSFYRLKPVNMAYNQKYLIVFFKNNGERHKVYVEKPFIKDAFLNTSNYFRLDYTYIENFQREEKSDSYGISAQYKSKDGKNRLFARYFNSFIRPFENTNFDRNVKYIFEYDDFQIENQAGNNQLNSILNRSVGYDINKRNTFVQYRDKSYALYLKEGTSFRTDKQSNSYGLSLMPNDNNTFSLFRFEDSLFTNNALQQRAFYRSFFADWEIYQNNLNDSDVSYTNYSYSLNLRSIKLGEKLTANQISYRKTKQNGFNFSIDESVAPFDRDEFFAFLRYKSTKIFDNIDIRANFSNNLIDQSIYSENYNGFLSFISGNHTYSYGKGLNFLRTSEENVQQNYFDQFGYSYQNNDGRITFNYRDANLDNGYSMFYDNFIYRFRIAANVNNIKEVERTLDRVVLEKYFELDKNYILNSQFIIINKLFSDFNQEYNITNRVSYQNKRKGYNFFIGHQSIFRENSEQPEHGINLGMSVLFAQNKENVFTSFLSKKETVEFQIFYDDNYNGIKDSNEKFYNKDVKIMNIDDDFLISSEKNKYVFDEFELKKSYSINEDFDDYTIVNNYLRKSKNILMYPLQKLEPINISFINQDKKLIDQIHYTISCNGGWKKHLSSMTEVSLVKYPKNFNCKLMVDMFKTNISLELTSDLFSPIFLDGKKELILDIKTNRKITMSLFLDKNGDGKYDFEKENLIKNGKIIFFDKKYSLNNGEIAVQMPEDENIFEIKLDKYIEKRYNCKTNILRIPEKYFEKTFYFSCTKKNKN